MNQLIDTHAHAYDEDLMKDYDGFYQRAIDHGLTKILLPNIDLESIQPMYDLVERNKDFFIPMMGIHPCSIFADYEKVLEKAKTELYTNPNRFCGVGEIGLDYHWDLTFKAEQIISFEMQIEWALDLDKPIAVHTRKSLEDVILILKKYASKNLKGVVHCFSGSIQQAEQLMKLGFMMGIGGVVTYPKAGLAEVVKDIPLEFLILETDAPYLTPVPFRGKTNEPSYVRYAAEKIAEVKNCTIEEVGNHTTQNATKLFRL